VAKEAADKKPLANDRSPVAAARPRLSTLQSRLARRQGDRGGGADARRRWHHRLAAPVDLMASSMRAASEARERSRSAQDRKRVCCRAAGPREVARGESKSAWRARLPKRRRGGGGPSKSAPRANRRARCRSPQGRTAAHQARTAAEKIAGDVDDHIGHDKQAQAAGDAPAAAPAPATTVATAASAPTRVRHHDHARGAPLASPAAKPAAAVAAAGAAPRDLPPPARPRSPRATRGGALLLSWRTPVSRRRWRWAAPTTQKSPGSVPVCGARRPCTRERVHRGPSSLPKRKGRRQSDSIGDFPSACRRGDPHATYQQIDN
jgi:hypothetical protein